MTVTLLVGRERSVRALEHALETENQMVVAAQQDSANEEPGPDDIYKVGALVDIVQTQRQEDGSVQVVVQATHRVRIVEVVQQRDFTVADVAAMEERQNEGPHLAALRRFVLDLFEQYTKLSGKLNSETVSAVRDVSNGGHLADLIAAHVLSDVAAKQEVLELTDAIARLEHVSGILGNELEVLELEQKIRHKVRQQIERNQKELYLREQLRAIQDELGGELGNEIADLRQRIEHKGLPSDIADRLQKEVTRLERMPHVSPEATVIRNYLDWVLALPWNERTEDDLDLDHAQHVLDEDHYGLEKVKDRIIEFLAVRQLRERTSDRTKGAILCLIGPPGVGKTSLGKSVARAMGRKFVRISLGGVRDEAEIRGHRRTYVGALPGRIIHGMKTAGSRNPVFLLDEIDKMTADFRGDPAAALLEVLDPEQNHTYTDHYLDMPYDLSQVLFIATGNSLHNLPRPLLDRMELIELPGYTEEEKIKIAQRFLLPKQIGEHGLESGQIDISERVIRTIISDYTREAGVRTLERRLGTICRKAARKVVQGSSKKMRVTLLNLDDFLGPARYTREPQVCGSHIGVVMGLAWTEHGGEMLPVEVATMPGHGNLMITGQLGNVMQESARAALSYARSRAEELSIPADFQEKLDLHIHLPEGAIPKDGPSAGITMATALISALSKQPIESTIAMTGEITLRGRVLRIGGFKEKVMAAHRAGVKKVVAPKENTRDLSEVPARIRRELEFVWVESMDQVLREALPNIEQKQVPQEPRPEIPLTGENGSDFQVE